MLVVRDVVITEFFAISCFIAHLSTFVWLTTLIQINTLRCNFATKPKWAWSRETQGLQVLISLRPAIAQP